VISTTMAVRLLAVALSFCAFVLPAFRACFGADDAGESSELRALPADAIREADRPVHADGCQRWLAKRRAGVNSNDLASWRSLRGQDDWERLRDERIAALRRALRIMEESGGPPPSRVTGVIHGDGYSIEKTLFASRAGAWVAAHVYVPVANAVPRSRPALVIVHSHHRPKEEGELQDMGRLWARAGCVVLVMDQIGHGERADHPFRGPEDWPGEFRASRQDYYFRFDLSIQLALLGESLIGWMVDDLRVAVDFLVARPDVDPERVAILGSVAGGGDPAATAAALDRRIAVAVPFNFGGPQPETRFPLPDDAEATFDYLGGAYWESTRNPYGEAAGGFVDWVIVASIAPRRVVYAHEFSWDRERDPVWRRLETVWSWYDARDALDFAHGKGRLSGRPPEASHCTNIGRYHRRRIHAALERWFGIDGVVDSASSERHSAAELRVWTDTARDAVHPKRVHALLAGVAEERVAAVRHALAAESLTARRERIRTLWKSALGRIDPASPRLLHRATDERQTAGANVERLLLETEPPIVVPTLLLRPARAARPPVVVCVSQFGKERFLRERSDEIAALLAKGIAVFLPDLRATGETRAGTGRGRESADTELSVLALQLGDPLVACRLRDLRAVLVHLRGDETLDGTRIAIWGDSFAPPNPADTDFRKPHGIDARPVGPEPLGALLALLAGLFENDVAAVVARGGGVISSSALASPFVYLPHDAVVPGALVECGDEADLAAAIAPRPLRIGRMVDALGRRADHGALESFAAFASAGYRDAGAAGELAFEPDGGPPEALAEWLAARLGRR